MDVFSYVELVQDCLERAEESQRSCLDGILKADLALRHSQSDADIHSIVLVRRAELLLIAVSFVDMDTNVIERLNYLLREGLSPLINT